MTDARSEIAARLERAGLPGEDAAGASEALTDLAAGRAPDHFVVRVANPAREVDGWGSTHTVVQIVIDDIAFVADSVTASLAQRGSEVHRLVEVRHGGRALLHVEIDRESDPGVLASLRAGIEDVLGDVRIAVSDWPAMRDEVQRLAATLRSDPPATFDRDDVTEAADFLEWLADDHFTFVASTECELVDAGEEPELRPLLGTELGVARRRLPRDRGGRGAALRQPRPLTLTKSTDRSTVHRVVPFDDVRVRLDAERERRFLGLYTSTVYTDSVTRIPVLRRKAAAVLGRAAPSHEERTLLNVLETLPRDELFRLPDRRARRARDRRRRRRGAARGPTLRGSR